MSTPTPAMLLDVNEAAQLIGCSKRTLQVWDNTGVLGPRSLKLGRLRRWRRDSLELWISMNCPPRRRFSELMKGAVKGSTASATKSAEAVA